MHFDREPEAYETEEAIIEYNGETMYITPFVKIVSGKNYITHGPNIIIKAIATEGLTDIKEQMPSLALAKVLGRFFCLDYIKYVVFIQSLHKCGLIEKVLLAKRIV